MSKNKKTMKTHIMGIDGNIEYISITTTLNGESVGIHFPIPASDTNEYGLCILGKNLRVGEDNPNFDLDQNFPKLKVRNLNDEKDPSKYLKS